MKYLISIFLFLIGIFSNWALWGQESDRSLDMAIEMIAEMIADESGETADFSDLIDELEQIAQSPFNLNLVDREQLERLPFLSEVQILAILEYRQLYGQLYSLNELIGVEGFNEDMIAILLPFVYLGALGEKRPNKILSELNVRTMRILEKSNAYQKIDGSKKYPGSQQKYYVRYKTSFHKLFDVGFTAENDAGEHFFGQSNKLGFDYYSGYFRYTGSSHVQHVILGDFQTRFGQGLIQWSGYGLRKSPEIARVRYMGQGIQPYTSTDENGGFRGLATQLKFGSISVLAYASQKKIDANVSVADELGNPLAVSSIQSTGNHRTQNEMDDENALREQMAGLSVRYVQNRFSLGVNGNALKYNVPLIPDDKPYNEFRFSGTSNLNASTDFAYILNKTSLFGEAAISKSKGTAFLLGLEALPSNELSFTMLYRDYQRNFQSNRGSAFAESSSISNERGLYGSFVLFPFMKARLSGYVDAYQFPWIKYTTCGPVRGVDTQLQFNYKFDKNVEAYLRLKNERNQEKRTSDAPIKNNADQQVQRTRIHIAWQVNDWMELKFRTEWSAFEKEDSCQNGFLVFADACSKFCNEKLSLQFRLAHYYTDGYDSRIYACESDMPSMFSVPAYFGTGFRTYLKLGYVFSSRLTFYGKYALSLVEKGATFGSGNDLIDANHKSDIRLHLKYRF